MNWSRRAYCSFATFPTSAFKHRRYVVISLHYYHASANSSHPTFTTAAATTAGATWRAYVARFPVFHANDAVGLATNRFRGDPTRCQLPGGSLRKRFSIKSGGGRRVGRAMAPYGCPVVGVVVVVVVVDRVRAPGPRARFSSRESRLHSFVHVFVFVELKLERYLQRV